MENEEIEAYNADMVFDNLRGNKSEGNEYSENVGDKLLTQEINTDRYIDQDQENHTQTIN